MEINGKTIEAGVDAAVKVSQPHVFATVVALASLCGIGLLVWNDSRRVEAQVAAMTRLSLGIDELRKEEGDRWLRLEFKTAPHAAAAPTAPAVWHR